MELKRYNLAEEIDKIIQNLAILNRGVDSPKNIIKDDFHNRFEPSDYKTRRMIDNGEDLNQDFDYCGESAIFYSIKQSNTETFKALIAHGADVNKKNDFGRTPLFWAARNSNKKYMRRLIQNGANINERGDDGDTPLNWAVRWSDYDNVQFLIENGADVNLSRDCNFTPLMESIGNGSNEDNSVFKLLLANGANAKIVNDHDGAALNIAARLKNKEIVTLLLEKGEDWVEINVIHDKDQEAMALIKKIKVELMIKKYKKLIHKIFDYFRLKEKQC
jgi:ankyrin repeat protein